MVIRKHGHIPYRGVRIERIAHSKQRYNTVGDWYKDKRGILRIRVSRTGDRRMDLLIAAHELHEARACLSAGVSDTLVDAFDFAHSVLDNTGQISEPGDNPKAPYHAEHVAATKIELTLARRLRVNWDRYGAHVERLYLM